MLTVRGSVIVSDTFAREGQDTNSRGASTRGRAGGGLLFRHHQEMEQESPGKHLSFFVPGLIPNKALRRDGKDMPLLNGGGDE